MTLIQERLLAWYDRHARVMPWRVGPEARRAGELPDPYRVWLSEVMLQQTTVAAVKAYFHRFTTRWPTVQDLAAAEDADVMAEWAGLGYYARARNLLACAREVSRLGGFPRDRDALLKLPGIGPYTAGSVSSIAFDQPSVVVDGNVERVISRLFHVKTPLPGARPELTALAASITPRLRPGDHAQAMMDLGATICTPRNPVCALCPLEDLCAAHAEGVQAELPRKAAKTPRPTRQGTVWLQQHGSGYVLEERPAKGLLGGMLGLPGDTWDGSPGGPPPIEADWQHAGEVRHIFTHFALELQVMVTRSQAQPRRGKVTARASFKASDLPTVMRKAFELGEAFLSTR